MAKIRDIVISQTEPDVNCIWIKMGKMYIFSSNGWIPLVNESIPENIESRLTEIENNIASIKQRLVNLENNKPASTEV